MKTRLVSVKKTQKHMYVQIMVLLTVVISIFLTNSARAEPFRIILTHLEPPLVPNSVLDLADQLGYFEREGVDVELVRVQQTPSALASILAGEGEMANVSVDGLLNLVVQGTDSLLAVSSPNKSLPFIIASTDELQNISDIAGRSFGIGRVGSLDHSLSTRVLNNYGIDDESLNFIALGQPSVRAQALAAMQIDATTMSIGVWLSIPDKNRLSVLVPQDAYYQAAPVVSKVNIVSERVLNERRAEVVGVLTALVKISRDFEANPHTWAIAMEPYRGNLSLNDMNTLSESFVGTWSVNGGMNRNELQYTQDIIMQSEDFPKGKPISLEDWVDFSPIDEALDSLDIITGADEPIR
jgi:NitT/TauT family transport system substrate-binding protein